MSPEHDRLHPVPDDQLLALASGELSGPAAERVRAHLRECPDCAARAESAAELHGVAAAWGEEPLDDVTRERLWSRLAPAVEAVVADRPARAARRVAGWAALAAGIAVVGLGVAWWAWGSGGGRSPADRAPSPGEPPARVAVASPDAGVVPGPIGHAPDAGVGLALRCGARHQGGRVVVVEDAPDRAVLRLEAGEVTVSSPPLPPGHRLEVRTEEARVTVVGTVFSVGREPAAGTVVTVTRGAVQVQPEGRDRPAVVLRPGERRAFVGEAAHLRELRLRFERAVDAGRHAEAAEAGARFLRAARSPAQAADVQVQLAAVLQRLGRTDESADLYRAAARSAASALTRQNAQAFLARLEAERGRAAAAEAAWRALRQAFPGGIYDREALLALARLGCSRRDAAATADRRELATRFGGQPEVRALLARCPGPDVAP